MKRLITIVGIVFATAYSATAQDPDNRSKIAACAGISGSVERLDCYDAIGRSAKMVGGPLASSLGGVGKWKVEENANPVDDSKTVVLRLAEDGNKAAMILRCMRGKPEAYISWAAFIGSNGTSVLTRLGDAKAETKHWSISTDHKGTFYPGDQAVFMNQLQTVDKFVAQVTPYGASPVTAVFDVSGLSNAIKPLRETCRLP